jgi:hypothetical protein
MNFCQSALLSGTLTVKVPSFEPPVHLVFHGRCFFVHCRRQPFMPFDFEIADITIIILFAVIILLQRNRNLKR